MTIDKAVSLPLPSICTGAGGLDLTMKPLDLQSNTRTTSPQGNPHPQIFQCRIIWTCPSLVDSRLDMMPGIDCISIKYELAS